MVGTKLLNKYGRLCVIKVMPTKKVTSKNGITKTRRMALCKCDCNSTLLIDIDRLKSGNTKSCGCLRKEVMSRIKGTHRLSNTVEYSTWCKMKDRCYNENIKDYKWYGAVGIKVCRRWKHSFENFISDMGLRPSDKHSIERRNSKKSYTPENCYWATKDVQIRNTKQIIWVIYRGKKRRLIEVCEELGLNPAPIRHRFRQGVSAEFLFNPIRINKRGKINQ